MFTTQLFLILFAFGFLGLNKTFLAQFKMKLKLAKEVYVL